MQIVFIQIQTQIQILKQSQTQYKAGRGRPPSQRPASGSLLSPNTNTETWLAVVKHKRAMTNTVPW